MDEEGNVISVESGVPQGSAAAIEGGDQSVHTEIVYVDGDNPEPVVLVETVTVEVDVEAAEGEEKVKTVTVEVDAEGAEGVEKVETVTVEVEPEVITVEEEGLKVETVTVQAEPEAAQVAMGMESEVEASG